MSSADLYVVQLLQAILAELKNNAKGETWPATLNIPSTAVLTIDFVDGTAKLSSSNPTFNTNIDIPQDKLLGMTVTNDGPNDIMYATNRPLNSGQANATLKT